VEYVSLDSPEPQGERRHKRRRLDSSQLPHLGYFDAVDILSVRKQAAVADEDLYIVLVFEMIAEFRDMLFHTADDGRKIVFVHVQDLHDASAIVRL
jgi:hypothetical protein